MKNYPFFLLFILFLSASVSCCKKEEACQDIWNPACENYDACFKKVSAEFKMQIKTEALIDQFFEVDTITKINAVYFTALDSTDVTYEWKIGNDPRVFTDRVIRIAFSNAAKIDVKLTVKRKSNCLTIDGGEQTLIKPLVIMEKSAISGKYVGYLESKPSEKFTIEIVEPKDSMFGWSFYFIDNLPNGSKRSSVDRHEASFGISYRFMDINNDIPAVISGGAFQPIAGVGQLTKDHSQLMIEYEMYNVNPAKYIKEKFIGTKTK